MCNQTGVTETLMGIDYDMNLYPRLAEGIEQASPTTWRVALREGLQFHDGTAVTVQAVVDAIAPISQEGHPSANARTAGVLDLAGMSAEGDRVVVFETNAPKAAFPWSLSEPGVAVLGPTSEAFPINATGPYIFREAIVDQLYRVEANPLIRRAVSWAIDRQGIVDAIVSGASGVPAATVVPAGMTWATDIAPAYDPAAAEALLTEAGTVKQGRQWMPEGEPLEIDIRAKAWQLL